MLSVVALPLWSLEGATGERVLVVTAGSAVPERHVRLPAEVACRLVRAWLLDPSARGALLDMHATVRGQLALSTPPSVEADSLLEVDLCRAFDVGDLVLVRVADVDPGTGPRPGVTPGSDPPQPLPKRSWIEIELVDEDGAPVATDLLLTLPDGTKRTIPFRGLVRIDDIDPGTCDIEFPKLDAREWRRTEARR